MDENNKIWSGLEAETYTAKFHFVLLERDYDIIYIDETTCKLIGRNGDDIDILLEFSAIERLNYELIGDLNSIYEDPDKIVNHIDNFIKYDESWVEPVDKTDWERFDFIDETDFAKFQQIHTVLSTGGAHLFQDQLLDYMKMSDENLATACQETEDIITQFLGWK